MMEIVWSDEAKEDYHQNIQFLLDEWSEEVAINFIEEVDEILNLVVANPELFPKVDYKKVRRAVIRKQITLYYLASKERIELVRFWNNYKNPNSLSL